VSAPDEQVPVRQLELRRGSKVVIEVLAEGRRPSRSAAEPGVAERRPPQDPPEYRYRWQQDVAGP
jgi:hypothetical protein